LIGFVSILAALLAAAPAHKAGSPAGGSPPEKREPTVITSDSLDMDYAKNMAVFKGRVHVKDPDGEMWADRMQAFYDPRRKLIRQLVATGRKVVTLSRGRRSVSREAVYTERDGKIVLSGEPRILQGRSVYSADKITIFKDSDKTVFEPRARMIVYSEASGTAFEGLP